MHDFDALERLALHGRPREQRGGRQPVGSAELRPPRDSDDPLAALAALTQRRAQRSTAEIADVRVAHLVAGRKLAAEQRKTVAAEAASSGVHAAWNAAAAATVQQQAPGWKRQRGRDCRSQLAAAIVRV